MSENARRANVFLTTWNSPPDSRTLARILSRAFIVTPVYSTRITAWLRFIQSVYWVNTSSLRSLVIAKGVHLLSKKSLCHFRYYTRQRLFAIPKEGDCLCPHLSRKLSPFCVGHLPSWAKWLITILGFFQDSAQCASYRVLILLGSLK